MVLRTLIGILLRTVAALFGSVGDGFEQAASLIEKKTPPTRRHNVVEELTDDGQPAPIRILPPEGVGEVLPGDFDAYYREQLRLRDGSPDDPRIDPDFDEIHRRVQVVNNL